LIGSSARRLANLERAFPEEMRFAVDRRCHARPLVFAIRRSQPRWAQSGGLLGEVEHRAPDSDPFTALPNEDPQIPARGAVTLTRPFVDHLVTEADHARVADHIRLVIRLAVVVVNGSLEAFMRMTTLLAPAGRLP
jgi:hypothetical protein